MSAKKRQGAPASGPPVPAPRAEKSISPPRPSRWQLAVSSLLVAAWLIFLAWMAFAS
ncbi:MAG: hypothetical protein SH868_11405 [Bythopirellula sp.]|nr:hypothetical protein [Bythopirellula sp.]